MVQENTDTLRDVISSAMDSTAAQADAPPSAKATAEDTPAADNNAKADRDAPQKRDAGGRYLASDGEGKATATAAQAEAAAATHRQFPRFPSSWKKELEAKWAALDPDVADFVVRREDDFHKGVEGYKAAAAQWQQMEKIIRPYMPIIEREGGDPMRAVASLLETAKVLRTADPHTKAAMLHRVAQQYGVALGGDEQQTAFASQLSQVMDEVNNLKSSLERERDSAARVEIQKFADGREHFDVLRPQMAQLLQAGIAADLQDAYDKALRLNDSLFQQSQAKQREAADRAEREKSQQAALKARAASVSIKGSGGSAADTAKPSGSLRDTLAAAFAAHETRI